MAEYIKKDDVIRIMENNSHIVEVFGTKRKMIDGMLMCYDLAELDVLEVDENEDD